MERVRQRKKQKPHAHADEEQCFMHKEITLEQMKEIMLPKAVDYFRQNANATVYQMIWKSEHGSAVIHFEKANGSTRRICMGTRRTFGGDRKRKFLQGMDQTRMTPNFLQVCGYVMYHEYTIP
ncbi:hypothetical protein EJB05_14168, partial [Eragrostis curvula]